jgi:hypothetical protein
MCIEERSEGICGVSDLLLKVESFASETVKDCTIFGSRVDFEEFLGFPFLFVLSGLELQSSLASP